MSKILLVEDEISLRNMYTKMLMDAKFTVDIAGDGEEALKKIASFQPDLVLLDLFIPKITGFEVLETIKSQSSTNKIKVIVLTNVYADKEELVKSGADFVLMKSEYTPEQVVEQIRTDLART